MTWPCECQACTIDYEQNNKCDMKTIRSDPALMISIRNIFWWDIYYSGMCGYMSFKLREIYLSSILPDCSGGIENPDLL